MRKIRPPHLPFCGYYKILYQVCIVCGEECHDLSSQTQFFNQHHQCFLCPGSVKSELLFICALHIVDYCESLDDFFFDDSASLLHHLNTPYVLLRSPFVQCDLLECDIKKGNNGSSFVFDKKICKLCFIDLCVVVGKQHLCFGLRYFTV